MASIMRFESYVEKDKKPEEKPRKTHKPNLKRCIGQCQRRFFIKEGKPVVYCPSCDRYLNQ